MKVGKIIFVANTSWYLWNFRAHLAQRLLEKNYEVFFVAPHDDYSARLTTIAPFVALDMKRKGLSPWGEAQTVWRLAKIIRKIQPDLLLTWTPKPNIYSAFVSRVLRIPQIPNVSGLGFAFIKGGWLATFVGLLYRLAFKPCSTVFFQNNDDREHFVRAGWVKRSSADLLPGSGVDLERFCLLPPRAKEDFVFLFVGRLLRDKGLLELVAGIKALNLENHKVRLRIVGFLDEEGNPAALARSEVDAWARDGFIEYMGPSDEVENFIADADCVVLPSYREGMPRILLEAAACGRPVITTDVPGCRSAIVPEQTGLLCEPRDAGSLTQAMKRMLELSATDRKAMGIAGRKFVEDNFSEAVVISQYLLAVRTASGGTVEKQKAASQL